MEKLTLRQIIEKHGSCVGVFKKQEDADIPVYAFDKYPPAKDMADKLTAETGITHEAKLVCKFT